jgi:hypothetical protein
MTPAVSIPNSLVRQALMPLHDLVTSERPCPNTSTTANFNIINHIETILEASQRK